MEENVLYNDAQQIDNAAKEKKKNKTKKVIATTTYFIAMLCLLAGLFAPLFNCVDGVKMPERMLVRYIPSMFNGLCGREILPPDKLGNWFLAYPFSGFDFMALIGVLYAVVCVIAILMFVPILLGSKKRNSSARCALGVEVLSMLVTLTYIAYATYALVAAKRIAPETPITWRDYNFLIAFGGALLMAIIQTVSSKGSIGVSKVIALLLSVLGVVAILDITLFIKGLADPLSKLPEVIGGGSEAAFLGGLDLGDGATNLLGIDGINLLIVLIKSKFELFTALAKDGGKAGIIVLVLVVLLILVALLTVINLISDVIGLSTGKKYKKDRSPCKNGPSNSFALTRYILTIIFAAAIIVMTMAIPDIKEAGIKPGVYLWLLVVVLLISLINAAARTAVDNARYKKGNAAPATEGQQRIVLNDPAFESQPSQPAYEPLPTYSAEAYNTETPAATAESSLPVYSPEEYTTNTLPPYNPDEQKSEPEYVAPDYSTVPYTAEPVEEQTIEPAFEPVAAEAEPVEEAPAPAPVVEPLSAPLEEPAEPTPTVYIYGGATDEFMETLTDNEKVEFVELFLKKSKGTVNGVPDYEIDGDNSDFFPAVFVHINRYRNIVSDALMTKMYKQLGKQMQ